MYMFNRCVLTSILLCHSAKLPGSGQFQCSTTGVGFTATGEGEVIYKIVMWEERRLCQTRRTPAGPLYSIQSPEESVCQLALPHCEVITPGKDMT